MGEIPSQAIGAPGPNAGESERPADMKDTIIGRHIRRTNRNRLILGVLLVAGALLICGLNSKFVDNFVAGPFAIKREALLAIKDPETVQHVFVRVHGDDITPNIATEVEGSDQKV